MNPVAQQDHANDLLRAILVNDASLAGHHGSALVTERSVALAAEAGIRVEHGWTWDAAEKTLDPAKKKFDLVIVNGEGSLHHDSRTARRIAALAQRLASKNIPAYLINASEEANGREVLSGLAAFRVRFVRDSASRASLARSGLDSVVVPDLTLTWPEAPAVADRNGSLLITDSSEIKKTERLMSLARRWMGHMVTLRAPPPWPKQGSPRHRIAFETKRLIASVRPPSPWSLRYAGALRTCPELARLLVKAGTVICGRYHATCFAVRLGLPFLAVEGNINKIGALLSDIGLAGRLVTLEELEAAILPVPVPPFSREEKERIKAFLSRAGEDAAAMFRRIAADARLAK